MTDTWPHDRRPIFTHAGASEEDREMLRALAGESPKTLQDRLWYLLHRSAGWEALEQRPPLSDGQELSDREEDARDWGFVLGMAIGLARAEEPCEMYLSVVERACVAALCWIERGGKTGIAPGGACCDDCDRDCSAAADVWRQGRWYDVELEAVADWYVVTDEAWKPAVAAEPLPDGRPIRWLCLSCLQRRLGRRLELSDFPLLPENRHARRLLRRLRPTP